MSDQHDGNDPGLGSGVPGAGEVPAARGESESAGTGTGGGPRARRTGNGGEGKRRKAPWWELPALVAVAIGVTILIKAFLIQPFYIPSLSMQKTLYGCAGCTGDRVLVNKLIYDFREPHPGDIVVFDAPPGWNEGESISRPPSNPVLRVIRGFGQLIGFVPPDGLVLVKRVIAVGGQTVMGDAAGHVKVSDHGPGGPYRTLVEPYVYAPKSEMPQQPFGPVTVPEGRLWVMGDHRTDSADSRFHCIPHRPASTDGDTHCNPYSSTVPIADVIGKAFAIAWPPSRWRTLGTPPTFEHDAMAAAPALPGSVALAAVAPIPLTHRRRRRRHRK